MNIKPEVASEAKVPPKGCQHYAQLNEMPWDIQKSVYSDFVFSITASLIASADITINALASSRNMTRAYG